MYSSSAGEGNLLLLSIPPLFSLFLISSFLPFCPSSSPPSLSNKTFDQPRPDQTLHVPNLVPTFKTHTWTSQFQSSINLPRHQSSLTDQSITNRHSPTHYLSSHFTLPLSLYLWSSSLNPALDPLSLNFWSHIILPINVFLLWLVVAEFFGNPIMALFLYWTCWW